MPSRNISGKPNCRLICRAGPFFVRDHPVNAFNQTEIAIRKLSGKKDFPGAVGIREKYPFLFLEEGNVPFPDHRWVGAAIRPIGIEEVSSHSAPELGISQNSMKNHLVRRRRVPEELLEAGVAVQETNYILASISRERPPCGSGISLECLAKQYKYCVHHRILSPENGYPFFGEMDIFPFDI